MELKEFLAKLDTDNPAYQEVCRYLTFSDENGDLTLAPKGHDLVEVVSKRLYYPLVDKRLQIVMGLTASHEIMRAILCAYHERLGGMIWGDNERTMDAAAKYIEKGYGYYLSRMEPDLIILSTNYRPDRFDKELFAFFATRDTL